MPFVNSLASTDITPPPVATGTGVRPPTHQLWTAETVTNYVLLIEQGGGKVAEMFRFATLQVAEEFVARQLTELPEGVRLAPVTVRGPWRLIGCYAEADAHHLAELARSHGLHAKVEVGDVQDAE